jgi:hypothetical protein
MPPSKYRYCSVFIHGKRELRQKTFHADRQPMLETFVLGYRPYSLLNEHQAGQWRLREFTGSLNSASKTPVAERQVTGDLPPEDGR